jgi:hypothetical protein
MDSPGFACLLLCDGIAVHMDYPFRDALIEVLDRYERTDPQEVMDALVSVLVAHAFAEGLDEGRVLTRVSDTFLATRLVHGNA